MSHNYIIAVLKNVEHSCRIKFFWILSFVMIAISTYSQALNSLSEAEKKEGWKLIYDGKTSQGWQSYNTSPLAGKWEFSDGSIHLIDQVKGSNKKDDLVTVEDYADFDLKMEWKVSDKGKSGILFRVQQDPSKNPHETGLQMEILDNLGYPERQNQKHWAGDLYDLIPASPELSKPAGQWNQLEIYCRADTLKFYINGSKVLATILWDGNWNTLVQNSVYKNKPAFGTYLNGKICLQNRGFEVWYRNIKIKRLNPALISNVPKSNPLAGTHWISCFDCLGSGQIVRHETVIIGYNQNGGERYGDKKTYLTCSICGGTGRILNR